MGGMAAQIPIKNNPQANEEALAKVLASALGLALNFAGRRFVVFPEPPSPDWKPQDADGNALPTSPKH